MYWNSEYRDPPLYRAVAMQPPHHHPQRTGCQPGTPSIQGTAPLSTGIPLLRCSNLFNFDLTVQGNPLTGRYVQTCSKWSTYGRQAGGWHPTGMLSRSEKSLGSFQRPIVTSDKGDFQIKTLESLCWCCTWDIAVFHIAVHHVSPYDFIMFYCMSVLHFSTWVYLFPHECIMF